MAKCKTFFLFLLLMISKSAFSVSSQCSEKSFRQFDFWLGEWQVTTAKDDIVRSNKITLINNGCTLLEEYSTPSGYTGKSFNIYDQQSKQWHQTWVDNSGVLLQLDGNLVGNSMVMTGSALNQAGVPILNKITWTPLSESKVRQHWQASKDKGVTWITVFDGLYTRKKPA